MIINFSSGATLAIMLVSSIFLSNSFSDNFLSSSHKITYSGCSSPISFPMYCAVVG